MAQQLALALSLDGSTCRRLRDAARELEAPAEQLAAIDRLENFTGTTNDVDLLAPLAFAICLPWEDLFPSRRGLTC